MSTALLELDSSLTRLREQYLQKGDIDSVKELNTIIKINRALTDANVSVFDTFTIVLKQLQISKFANRGQEVFSNAYDLVQTEFRKYKDATEQKTLDPFAVFNIAKELETTKLLAAQLEAVVEGIAAHLDSKAPAVQLEVELEKAQALTAQIKAVFENVAAQVGSESLTTHLEASIEAVEVKLEKIIHRNSNSPS